MQVIEYDPKYRQDFIDFNTDWITDHFGFLEDEDRHTFANIENIIKNGGMVFFAVEGGVCLATCMVHPLENNSWELCKLASNKRCSHRGCGSAVFEAAANWAIDHGAARLFLISNSKLKPALHIYEKYGFREKKLDNYEYVRGDIAFERIIKES